MVTFVEAAALAVREFYTDPRTGEFYVPDGGYLKVEPVEVGAVTIDRDDFGWAAVAGRSVVARLITDMYGPHPTLIGVICGTVDDCELVWQDM
jgi:hypothetical protein